MRFSKGNGRGATVLIPKKMRKMRDLACRDKGKEVLNADQQKR